MLTDKEKKCLKDVLKLMPEKELRLLSMTVTNNMVVTDGTEDAMEAILLHSASVESLLSRKRLSREILFRYLHNKKIAMLAAVDKRAMINKILELWNCTSLDNQPKTSVVESKQSVIVDNETTTSKSVVCEIAEMAFQFTKWFYSMLNQHEVQDQGTRLGMEHFWQDCNMCLVLHSEMDSSKLEVKNSAANVVQLLCDTKIHHNLYFNPNMSSEGVQGRTDAHGLVMVVACGTLHQQDKCVGVFEQLFGLIRDPLACNNWKIKYTELNLKSKNIVANLPTLAEGNLLKSITCPLNSIQSV